MQKKYIISFLFVLFLPCLLCTVACQNPKLEGSVNFPKQAKLDVGEAWRKVRFNPCLCSINRSQELFYDVEVQDPNYSNRWERVAVPRDQQELLKTILAQWQIQPMKHISMLTDLQKDQYVLVNTHTLRILKVLEVQTTSLQESE